MPNPSRSRLVLAGIVSVGLVAAAVMVPSFGHQREGSARRRRTTRAHRRRRDGRRGTGTGRARPPPRRPADQERVSPRGPDRPAARTRRPRSRPTASRAYVASSRAMADPELTTATVRDARARVPQDRYAMAGGCYRLRRRADPLPGDRPRHLPALHTGTGSSSPATATASRGPTRPSTDAEFTVRRQGDGVHLHAPRRRGAHPHRRTARGSRRARRRTRSGSPRGCAAYPEAGTDVSGRPHAGVTPSRRCAGTSTRTPTAWPSSSSAATCTAASRGTGTASPYALVDCPDHTLTERQGRGRSRRSCPASPTPRPGRLADVQGLAGAATR